MSSLYVRTVTEGWMKDAAMLVPYYETINMENNPKDSVWCTCDFSSTFREKLTFCDGANSEEGEVEIVYFGSPGIGYQSLLQALETEMITLMSQRDSKLSLTSRSAPFEYSGGSADKMYALSVYVDYQYYE
jgi:hypothetical protein